DTPGTAGAPLADDRLGPRGGRQRVFDEDEVEACGQEPLAEESVWLLVVHLPVAAVDVDERRGAGTGAGEHVEAMARPAVVVHVETGAGQLANGVAAPAPVRHV